MILCTTFKNIKKKKRQITIRLNIRKTKKWGKGGFEFLTNWVELSFFGLLAGGFVLGKFVTDITVLYLLAAAVGLVAGRLVYVKRENDPWPFYAIGLAFLVGYLFGHRIGSGIVIAVVFAAAAAISYYLHKNIDFLA